MREEQMGTDERLREEQMGTDERLREEQRVLMGRCDETHDLQEKCEKKSAKGGSGHGSVLR